MDERMRFVIRLKDGESMASLCREFGISRKTGYKIFERYEECGLDGLSDRTRRPIRYANQLPEQVESAIVAARREKPCAASIGVTGGDGTCRIPGGERRNAGPSSFHRECNAPNRGAWPRARFAVAKLRPSRPTSERAAIGTPADALAMILLHEVEHSAPVVVAPTQCVGATNQKGRRRCRTNCMSFLVAARWGSPSLGFFVNAVSASGWRDAQPAHLKASN